MILNKLLHKTLHKIIAFVLVTWLVFSPVSALAEILLEQSVNRKLFEIDGEDRTVVYTLNVKNNNSCSAPIDVVIAFDKSGSMDDDGKNPSQPLTDAKEAANVFIDTLRRHVDQVALVSYASKAKRDSPLRSDGRAVKNLINKLRAGGATNQYDAVKTSREELASVRHNPEAKPIILIFSDGEAHGPTNNPAEDKRLAIEQATIAKNAGITVVSVGLGKSDKVDTDTLKKMASPGHFFWAPDGHSMKEIYQMLARSLSGTSSQTVVWDDVSQLLQVADFESASDGGRLENGKVMWDLGDLECGAQRQVSYAFKFKKTLNKTFTRTNNFGATNSLSENYKSNELTIRAISPSLSLSLTDNRSTVENQDEIEYEVKIKNIGQGRAEDIDLRLDLPEYVNYLSDDTGNSTVENNSVSWLVSLLASEQEATFKFKTKLVLPELYFEDRLISEVIAKNENQEVSASDETEIIFDEGGDGGDNSDVGGGDGGDNEDGDDNSDNEDGSEGDLTDNQEVDLIENMPLSTGSLRLDQIQALQDGSLEASQANVEFTFTEKNVVSDCQEQKIQVKDAQITADEDILLAEYTLDNGQNWYPIKDTSKLRNNQLQLNFTTRSLEDNLYGIVLRVQTISGGLFYSDLVTYAKACETNRSVILGSYYQNGQTNGVLDANGDLIYNSSLPLKLYVETLGGISKMSATLQGVKIEMRYDFETESWEVEIPTEVILGLDDSVLDVEVIATTGQGDELQKQLPRIIKIERQSSGLADLAKQSGEFDYKIFSKNTFGWVEVDLENTRSLSKKNELFNLLPGNYYIQCSSKTRGFVFNTKEFTLKKPSVVRVLVSEFETEGLQGFLNQFFDEIEVEVFNNQSTFSKSGLVDTRARSEGFINLLKAALRENQLANSKNKENKSVLIGAYWNRWNPYIKQQLSIYSQLAEEYDSFVLFVDSANYDELVRAVSILDSEIEPVLVTETEVLHDDFIYAPEVVIYDEKLEKLIRVRPDNNYEQLNEIIFNFQKS